MSGARRPVRESRASSQPSERPRTAAGRALLDDLAYTRDNYLDPILAIEAEAAAPDPVLPATRMIDMTATGYPGVGLEGRSFLEVPSEPPEAAAPDPVASPAPLDFEEMRREMQWPTPISMRHAADGLDSLAIPKYGDVLRWMADACDAALEGQPVAEEPRPDQEATP